MNKEKEQFIKDVENFFEKHKLFEMKDGYGGYMNECKCGWNDYSDIRYDEHLLQEIKKGLEHE